jgi:hypothetical protein
MLSTSHSPPPFRFLVLQTFPGIFMAVARDCNVANYIVARGNCKLGDLHLTLFPDLPSAAAFLHQADARDNDLPQYSNAPAPF